MDDNESPTEYIRRVLFVTKDEFSADLFCDVNNSSAILFKFACRGEIAFVRWEPNKSTRGGRPYKIYRVLKMMMLKQRDMHSAKPKSNPKPRKPNVIPLHPVAQNWKDAFPALFTVPEFKILGITIHKGDMT